MRRTWIAWLLAPVVALVIVWGAVIAYGALWFPADLTPLTIGHSAFFFAFFGVPLAYFASYLLALPAFLLLERSHRLTAGPILASAAGCGALAVAVADQLLFGWHRDVRTIAAFGGVGALAGLAAGAVFYATGLRHPSKESVVDQRLAPDGRDGDRANERARIV